jgi:hypothetical protein
MPMFAVERDIAGTLLAILLTDDDSSSVEICVHRTGSACREFLSWLENTSQR